MGEPHQARRPEPDDHDPIPLFGTWPAIYWAVVISALVVMGLIALFSGWSF
jgi:hypothetical protein